MYRKCDLCGKNEARAQVQGKASTREYRFAQMHVICKECEEKAREKMLEHRRKENIQAKQENEKNGLPELIGSAKQIAWAEKIRNIKIKNNIDTEFFSSCEKSWEIIDRR